jgi:hypothetical protein
LRTSGVVLYNNPLKPHAGCACIVLNGDPQFEIAVPADGAAALPASRLNVTVSACTAEERLAVFEHLYSDYVGRKQLDLSHMLGNVAAAQASLQTSVTQAIEHRLNQVELSTRAQCDELRRHLDHILQASEQRQEARVLEQHARLADLLRESNERNEALRTIQLECARIEKVYSEALRDDAEAISRLQQAIRSHENAWHEMKSKTAYRLLAVLHMLPR